jgi:hypothetical protein
MLSLRRKSDKNSEAKALAEMDDMALQFIKTSDKIMFAIEPKPITAKEDKDINPLLAFLANRITDFKAMLLSYEHKLLSHKTYCNQNLIELMKAKVSNIFVEIISCRILSARPRSCCHSSVFNDYQNLRQYLADVNIDTRFYSNSVGEVFAILFEGYYHQKLRYIDSVLENTEIDIYDKMDLISDTLVNIFRSTIVQLNNLQIDCKSLSSSITPNCNHDTCMSFSGNYIMFMLTHEHFEHPFTLMRVIRLLKTLDTQNLLLCVDLMHVSDTLIEITSSKMVSLLIDTIKSFKTYYFTNCQNVKLLDGGFDSDRIITSNEQLKLVHRYWNKNKTPISISKANTLIKEKTKGRELLPIG